jgi:hypothetical protein
MCKRVYPATGWILILLQRVFPLSERIAQLSINQLNIVFVLFDAEISYWHPNWFKDIHSVSPSPQFPLSPIFDFIALFKMILEPVQIIV